MVGSREVHLPQTDATFEHKEAGGQLVQSMNLYKGAHTKYRYLMLSSRTIYACASYSSRSSSSPSSWTMCQSASSSPSGGSQPTMTPSLKMVSPCLPPEIRAISTLHLLEVKAKGRVFNVSSRRARNYWLICQPTSYRRICEQVCQQRSAR